ncbi:hypothetical protein BCR35DRAFT_354996 [Leucosporidium creatinivorum]|uniref:Uncharacterized protein n=1 Tax=Leucosporidium creatinivorum TaxID=106004 RepID=A0A1Y2DZD8_9BASI|nr:hypothetical protein BCR35DRAFT_354996 [Leucosporidium creatinivorum]
MPPTNKKRPPPSKKGRSTSLLPKIRSHTSSLPLKSSVQPQLRTKKQKEAQKARDATARDGMNGTEQDWRHELVQEAAKETSPLVQPKPAPPKELANKGGELADALKELEVAMSR